MNSYEYLQQAANTESRPNGLSITDDQVRLLHAALGLQTESAEFSDMLKRNIFYGSRVDRVNALEEMGDILWYMAIVINHFNSSFGAVMAANIAKMK